MSNFQRFSILSFAIIFCSLLFIFYTLFSSSPPDAVYAYGQPEEVFAAAYDSDSIFENEYIYVADSTDEKMLENYQNNLNYFKEQLYTTFKNNREVVSFLYYDICTGYSFSYNEAVEFPTASTIKTSLAIYIMDLASQGKTDLEKKLTYSANFSYGGTGVLQGQSVGTQYTVAQLLEHMIVNSDNIAYRILLAEYGYKNSQDYWYSLGTTTTYRVGSSWGTITANDALIYLRQLYRFYREDEQYGKRLMDLFKAARFRYIAFATDKQIEIAHKSGSTSAAMNDLSIIFHEQPFVFIVLTRKDAMLNDRAFFTKATEDIYAFHQYFWNNISCRYLP